MLCYALVLVFRCTVVRRDLLCCALCCYETASAARAAGYAYLPHNKNVHGLLVSLSWTFYAMCVLFCLGAMLTKVAYGNPKFM